MKIRLVDLKLWLITPQPIMSFEVSFPHNVPLTPGNEPIKSVEQLAIWREKSEKFIFLPLKWPPLARSRSFEIKFQDKALFAPSNVLTVFHWNNLKQIFNFSANQVPATQINMHGMAEKGINEVGSLCNESPVLISGRSDERFQSYGQ